MNYHKNDSQTDEIDDLIISNGFGVTTCWRYPEDINYCLNLGCGLIFENRSDAIKHYKRQHADHFVFCSICTKPVSVDNFKRHCKNIHRNGEIPTDSTGNNIQGLPQVASN